MDRYIYICIWIQVFLGLTGLNAFGGKIWPRLGDCPSDFRIILAGDSINLRGVHSEGQKV